MATLRETISALIRALEQSPLASDIGTFAEDEMDWAGADSRDDFPVCEFNIVSQSTSDYARTGIVQNEANETIGVIYTRSLTARIQISIHVLSGTSQYPTADHVALGDDLQLALSEYVADGNGALLPDGDGGGMADISVRSVEEGRSTSSTGGSGGSIRKYVWHQDVVCDITQRLNTVDEYGPRTPIAEVNVPADGDYYGTLEDGELRANPPYRSQS